MTEQAGAGAPDPAPKIQVEADFEQTWPGASALASACILNLTYLNERMAAFAESLVRRHGIPSVAAFNALEIVRGAGEPLPPSTIAERMIVSRPTVTGILGTLERHGLIRRTPSARDRRMSLVAITPTGRARVERLLPELHLAERQWLDCLTEAEQHQLLRLIAKLQANALDPIRSVADPAT